jgi:high-affinity nickel-transport protein
MLSALSEGGFGFGLLIASFWFGFRHGIDWDHIAAITDITSSQEERGRAIWFGTLYVVGHAAVVLALGVVAVLVGQELPESVDAVMGRIVGVTLIALGVYVFVSLIRHGREFRMRSRWMLVFAGVRTAWWKVTGRRSSPAGTHDHEREPVHVHAAGADAVDAEERVAEWHHGHHGRPGHHHHKHPEPDDPFVNYQKGTSILVGMLHGIGAETPTQILIFTAAAGAGGKAAGIAVLAAFLVGLMTSNSIITVGTAFGFLRASKNFAVYAAVAVVTGVFSLAIGVLFVLGKDTVLPALFAG